MNKLKITKETVIKLGQVDAEAVQGGKILPSLRTCNDNCTDSCIMTNKKVICCY